MSRFMRFVLPIPLLTFAHCSSSTSPGASLTGLWNDHPLPPGSGMELSLSGVRNVIQGTGADHVNGSVFDSCTVTGRWNPDRSFHLSITFRRTTPATYDGAFAGPDQLDGTLTRNGQAEPHVAFYRQTQ